MGQRICGSGIYANFSGFNGSADTSYDKAQGPNDIQQLRLPNRNQFLPTNLDVEKHEITEVRHFMRDDMSLTLHLKPQRRPRLIHETHISQVWHKKDDQFWLPKASVVIEIRR